MRTQLLGVIQVYTRMGIQRRWRAWLTSSAISRWLKNGRYYQLNLVSGDHQNPEYRIAEDFRVATDAPIDFATGVTSAFLSATTFIIVLWTIGGAFDAWIGDFLLPILQRAYEYVKQRGEQVHSLHVAMNSLVKPAADFFLETRIA